jgi:hypothetical protein
LTTRQERVDVCKDLAEWRREAFEDIVDLGVELVGLKGGSPPADLAKGIGVARAHVGLEFDHDQAGRGGVTVGRTEGRWSER